MLGAVAATFAVSDFAGGEDAIKKATRMLLEQLFNASDLFDIESKGDARRERPGQCGGEGVGG